MPVLFFIHGGFYVGGSGNDNEFGPDFIIEKRTILVTFNFRLTTFGFLSLGTPEYSGNMGLKDQLLALKWIHKNIEYFNGDKNKITMIGQSSGAISTHFHILNSESRKYFRNAILVSGSAFNYWATSEQNDHLEFAHKLAKDAGKQTDQNDELIEVLLTLPPNKLVEAPPSPGGIQRTFTSRIAPVIESNITTVEKLISNN